MGINPERRIKLEGHLDVPADRWNDVLLALDAHVQLTRAEAGCLRFDVPPCSDVKHRLRVSEVFADQRSFDAHQQRTSHSEWAQISAGIERRYEITEVIG